MAKAIFDDNSMFLELLGLTDSATDAAVTTAVVAGAITDEADATVWSGALTYLGTAVTRNGVLYNDGNYRATIPEDTAYATKTVANKTRYQRHWAKITADDGINRDGLWREPLVVRYRDFGE